MTYELTASERDILERIAREEKPVYVRRARLLLLREQGLAPKEIGPQVGLSAGRVRYWLREFRKRRMGVFPDDLLTVVTPASPLSGRKKGGKWRRLLLTRQQGWPAWRSRSRQSP